LGRLRARQRGQFADRGQQFAHPEIVERTAEIDRGQMALAIGLRVERRAQSLRHLDLLAQFGECSFRQTASKLGVVEAIAADRFGDPVVDAALEQYERIGEEVIGVEKVAPMPIGQEAGVTSSARACSISSNRSNGSRASRSSLLTKVMIGTSRSRQTSKSLRVCSARFSK
jgi:hypothetical protein